MRPEMLPHESPMAYFVRLELEGYLTPTEAKRERLMHLADMYGWDDTVTPAIAESFEREGFDREMSLALAEKLESEWKRDGAGEGAAG